jgi:hypothetical protein
MCRFSLQHCTLLNISVCTASVQSSAAGTGFQLLLYNSLAWERTESVRVPLTGAHTWAVKGTLLTQCPIICMEVRAVSTPLKTYSQPEQHCDRLPSSHASKHSRCSCHDS